MGYRYSKIEIEDVGTFTVAKPVADLLFYVTGQRDGCKAEVARLRAEIERIRTALGGYPDSDLAALAETLNVRNVAAEDEVARQRAGLSWPAFLSRLVEE